MTGYYAKVPTAPARGDVEILYMEILGGPLVHCLFIYIIVWSKAKHSLLKGLLEQRKVLVFKPWARVWGRILFLEHSRTSEKDHTRSSTSERTSD